jgi:hypothetical protein
MRSLLTYVRLLLKNFPGVISRTPLERGVVVEKGMEIRMEGGKGTMGTTLSNSGYVIVLHAFPSGVPTQIQSWPYGPGSSA